MCLSRARYDTEKNGFVGEVRLRGWLVELSVGVEEGVGVERSYVYQLSHFSHCLVQITILNKVGSMLDCLPQQTLTNYTTNPLW